MSMAEIEFGLHLLAGDASLTFVAFLATTLLAVVAARFGLYSYLNMRASDLADQRAIWAYLLSVGAAATAYGLVGVLEIVSSVRAPFKSGIMLAVVLLLALSVREIAESSTATGRGDGGAGAATGRLAVELGSAGVAVAVVVGIGAFGLSPALLALQGVGGMAFAGYGFWFGRRQTAASMVRGTMIDSLLRHLLPVLAFAMLVPAADLASVAGLDRTIVVHVQIVFVIMTATALMTATIKLRQNLATF